MFTNACIGACEHICTVTYKCLEEGGERKGRERKYDLVRERTRKKRKQRGQAGENYWERKRETEVCMKEA